MEINPLNIFMFILRMAPAIITIVIIGLFFLLLKVEIRTDDLERASVELTENIFVSELTSSKYVFDRQQLDKYDQSNIDRKTELPFLRACSFAYFIAVEDLQSGKEWEFGHVPPRDIDIRVSEYVVKRQDEEKRPSYVINDASEREFLASIQEKDTSKPSNYYGSVKQAKVGVKIYDTWLVRSTCLVEKAFTLKEVQKMEIPCIVADYRGGNLCGFSLQRHPDDSSLACSFQRELRGLNSVGEPEERDCRYFPQEISFVPIDSVFQLVKAENFRISIVAYPIKEGASVPSCVDAKNSNAIAKKQDNVQTVLLCAEKTGDK